MNLNLTVLLKIKQAPQITCCLVENNLLNVKLPSFNNLLEDTARYAGLILVPHV